MKINNLSVNKKAHIFANTSVYSSKHFYIVRQPFMWGTMFVESQLFNDNTFLSNTSSIWNGTGKTSFLV
jgi:hypothetical protein